MSSAREVQEVRLCSGTRSGPRILINKGLCQAGAPGPRLDPAGGAALPRAIDGEPGSREGSSRSGVRSHVCYSTLPTVSLLAAARRATVDCVECWNNWRNLACVRIPRFWNVCSTPKPQPGHLAADLRVFRSHRLGAVAPPASPGPVSPLRGPQNGLPALAEDRLVVQTIGSPVRDDSDPVSSEDLDVSLESPLADPQLLAESRRRDGVVALELSDKSKQAGPVPRT